MKKNDKQVPDPKKSKDLYLKVVILIIAVIPACIIRFTVSIADLESSGHSKMWLGVAFIAGLAGGIIYRKNFFYPVLLTTLGFFIAILLRIVYDLIFIDPTSHNLFPVELIIWSIMAFIPALAGAFLSAMIFKLINKDQSKSR